MNHVTLKKELLKKKYTLTRYNGNYFYLFYKDAKGFLKSFKTHALDDLKNQQGATNELTIFKQEFKEINGKSFLEAFGRSSHDWKQYVPGLFHADNPIFLDRKINKVGKVDFSSHFVACSLGRLPDANSAIILDHYEEPNEEYPFAFYPSSHHIAEYQTFDSRSWMKDWSAVKSLWKPENDYNAKDEVTILMKPSEFTLDKQLLKLYEVKRNCVKGSPEYQLAKLTMLKMIGKFEQNDPKFYNSNPYAHIAAIVKGRAIQRMIEVIDRIGKENVMQVIVDGLIYSNLKGIALGDDTEKLGSLKQEFLKANCQMRRHNQYILEEDGVIDKCHAGLDVNIESNNIKDWKASGNETFRHKLEALSQIEYLNK